MAPSLIFIKLQALKKFVTDLEELIPNATYFKRKRILIRNLIAYGKENDFTDLIIITEKSKKPGTYDYCCASLSLSLFMHVCVCVCMVCMVCPFSFYRLYRWTYPLPSSGRAYGNVQAHVYRTT